MKFALTVVLMFDHAAAAAGACSAPPASRGSGGEAHCSLSRIPSLRSAGIEIFTKYFCLQRRLSFVF